MPLTEEKAKEIMQKGRNFMSKWDLPEEEDYEPDQSKKLPQPPLTKAPMRENAIALPQDFENLDLIHDAVILFHSRKSHRVYTKEKINELQLSWLLWTTQGIKSIRGKRYATLRTVPSAGARHPFECYMLIQNVEGFEDGSYHYLPMKHEIELLYTREQLEQRMQKPFEEIIGNSLYDQVWANKANVVFYYSMVAYRAEWRYGIRAHRVALIDAGHITENLYLACASNHLGCCAIGALDTSYCDKIFELDGKEEFSFYAASVGTISKEDADAENSFYAFIKEEDL